MQQSLPVDDVWTWWTAAYAPCARTPRQECMCSVDVCLPNGVGNLVSNARIVRKDGPANVQFGLRRDGTIFVGCRCFRNIHDEFFWKGHYAVDSYL